MPTRPRTPARSRRSAQPRPHTPAPATLPDGFNPDDAAKPGSGVFGLPYTLEQARIVLLPVPFDATTSFGGGTSGGPEAIRAASAQVDLHDGQFGDAFRCGIHMTRPPRWILPLSRRARAAALPIIRAGGIDPRRATKAQRRALETVGRASERIEAHTRQLCAQLLAQGKVPGLIGGDHSTPLGAIRACAEHAAPDGGIGLLHVDAHLDLRDSFEGFAQSHASIMHNVLTHAPGVRAVVSIGIRDAGRAELDLVNAHPQRLYAHTDLAWAQLIDGGRTFTELVQEALGPLPQRVYVSFDIDGLDPSLCPHTGTPVPGGLSFQRASMLLGLLVASGRRVIGFDLVEVCPGPRGNTWDATVGARVLYKLCGAAAQGLASQGHP
ncbi:MAG: arginase [Planctomyces sp.]|nr:arginase [Planctomyces sp.]MBA4119442.1 arginase [Isosphaera sp.]